MLIVSNVSKSYPQRGVVLDKLELELRKGETVAITGPSGSGKTTLLNIIGLLDRPDSGSIKFNNAKITGLNPDQSAGFRKNNFGFVFQEHLLLPHLTIIENIYLPLLMDRKNRQELISVEKYVNELLKKTGISGIENKFPALVSGGEAQRATLVRALVNKPVLLLADEPTGSLDSRNAEDLGNLLLEMNTVYETTIIAVTHSQDLADKLGKKLQLRDGHLTGPSAEKH
ncbi:MAG: ATP-binding cassette domain-containing protein [Bacteroidetes bacterium]|nr:ATP-binding cassette domain-containing protein [Bacteroidota bacterium]